MSLSKIVKGLRTVRSVVRDVKNVANTANTIKNTFENIADGKSFVSHGRMIGLPSGAQYTATYSPITPTSQTSSNDWRVRLHLPTGIEFFQANNSVLAPLRTSGNSMVFPATPQVVAAHSANYNTVHPTHSNYAFNTYENSSVDDISISAEWPVENEADGKYWIASTMFLRAVTKMFYGKSSNSGAPPPLVYLSGYGDVIYNKVPVVVKQVSVDFPANVDYIKVPVAPGSVTFSARTVKFTNNDSATYSYVPTLGRFNILVSPTYSRNEVSNFSLDEFTKGHYIGTNKGII
jgi:hypothetical protein